MALAPRPSYEPVLAFLRLLWQPGDVREFRAPKHNRFRRTASGYFDSPEKLASAASEWDGRANVYVTLNPVDPALLARSHSRIIEDAEHTTADVDVVCRRWLFIDIDPDRPSGISSTEAEKEAARELLDAAIAFLDSRGWPAPVTAMSGNGYYGLYAVDLRNESEVAALLKGVLEALAARLNTEAAHIDTSVYNAARIIGLVGTWKLKGDSTDERPHRRSQLISVPDQLVAVSEEQLRSLVMTRAGPEEPRSTHKGRASRLTDLLDAAGIEYREQPPDANGVTWFHVRRCPFHGDGRDFECGVGQKLPDGAYAGKCFHPEGTGKGWQEWKVALGLRVGGADIAAHDHSMVPLTPTESEDGARPAILVTNRHLRDLAARGWDALLARNYPPTLFVHGNAVAALEGEADSPGIAHLSQAALKGRLDRAADWLKHTKVSDMVVTLPARPPEDVVEDMLAMDKPLPPIKGITGTPTFARDGTLCTEPGYQPSTRLFYLPRGEGIPAVPDEPDETDLKRAKAIVAQECLADFPFADEASRAHSFALPLTAIAREMIEGPTPLYAIDAPAAGTGKGLLARCFALIVDGNEPAIMTETKDEEEMRKRITSLLMRGRPLVQLDNVKRRLESSAFEGLLTSTVWSDRVLGRSETVEVPNRAIWMATGNNLQLGTEVARRTVWIRLDAKVDRPWERTSFRHADLAGWVARHRHELLWAFLVLVQHWLTRGSHGWTGRLLGSFEAWSAVIGGILEEAGIPGFLTNRAELYKRADQETEEWRAFTERWWQERADAPVTTADLYPLAAELLPGVFGLRDSQATERALKTKLASALRGRVDRRFGERFLRKAGEDGHTKAALWRLEPASDSSDLAVPLAAPDRGTAEVPHDFGPISDSFAVPAVPAVPDRRSYRDFLPDSPGFPGGGKQVPQVPQVPQPDSDPLENQRYLEGQGDRGPAEVPQTPSRARDPCRGGCGRQVSPGQMCSACATKATAEWVNRQKEGRT